MSPLSDRQRDELHKSLLDYLQSCGYEDSARALRLDAGLDDIKLDPTAKYAGLLEKKWTSVIRLQRKVMELESKNSQLSSELSTPAMATKRHNTAHFLPSLPKHTLSGHRSAVVALSFHPKFVLLASASDDCSVKIWDWDVGECERTLKGHTKAVLDVDYDATGTLLASCSSDTSIKLWDALGEYSNTKTLYGHDESVSCVRFLSDSNTNTLISCGRDESIRFWDVHTGYCTRSIHPHSDWIRVVLPSDDSSLLATASSDQTAMVVDTATGTTVSELRGHEHVVESVAWAPTTSIANIHQLIGESGTGSNRDNRASGSASTNGIPNNKTHSQSQSQSRNRYLATASRDKSVKLWDTSSFQCVYTFNGHDNWVKSIVFHPAGTHLLSCSEDKSIKIWDLATGRCTRTIEAAHRNFVNTLSWGRQAMPEVGVSKSMGLGKNNNNNLNRRFSMPHPPPTMRSMSSGDVLRSVHQREEEKEEHTVIRPLNVIASASSDGTIKIWTP
ncbi:hypothetical protein E3P89_01422 [Wallemia ichthyophaga]|uniref:Nuclear distribution protein PAC1 n=1 Tax=Wallemia ichthyophaga TaxID=245174 RepID=A0A4T0J3V8_WALIC|nr:hypothetical protein E3P98_01683 [Wallemia ichthyophaga]TIA91523.1 hypothetical protein E3P97_01987 [Wallemia ichthyophaga]TIB06485.1 hypothetical protein E3P96_00363 [Wallemia ichthyophaga]TIB13046.1 hypothetical protein E3P90_01822 [Wallemia ichthyophaga]TIB14707.1 hypothetical protein E3P93_01572 [Wallemia ichthyophaga]